MITLAYPWLLLLALLPLAVRYLVSSHREPRRGLVVPFLDRAARVVGSEPTSGAVVLSGGWLRTFSVWTMWLCVVLALARPQIIEEPITKTVPTRDLLLAVDLSGSMETRDFTNAVGETVDRLTAVKEVIDEFLQRREGDRVGLIFFGTAAFVQAPFTEDLDVCRQLLDEAQVRMAGPRTALGDAMGLAISVFDRSEVKERVLIALTDGNDTGSKIPPAKAAEIARDKGIVVHTIAAGDPEAAGEEALDIETLKRISSITGGLYSFAANREELEQTYAKLDELETVEAETISHRPRTDIYWWALAVGFFTTLLQHAIQLAVAVKAGVKRSSKTEDGSVVFASFAPLTLIGVLGVLNEFHFLRPVSLLATVPVGLLLWALHRAGNRARSFQGVIAEHLVPHLMSRTKEERRVGPFVLIGIGWFICVIALAGPTWRQEPNPFAEDTSTLAIVIRVNESMKTPDVQPDRLTRAKQKIGELLGLRQGGKTTLIAYSGSAHVVMPPTTDGGMINSFAESLDPQIMPVEGDSAAAAIQLAAETIEREGGGSILWITDGVSALEVAAIGEHHELPRGSLLFYPPLLQGKELDDLDDVASSLGADVVRLTADDSDVHQIARNAEFSSTSLAGTDGRWEDGGYWLMPVLALVLLPFFRRGWMITSAAKS